MRVVFMGTPEIAADVLKSVNERFEVCGVFCQPDKPVGRKQILTAPPVKELAVSLGLDVYQPKGFKNGKATEIIKNLAPDAILVVAYGKILPKAVLDIPKYGCINLHGSILPKYRGSAPIQRAVMDGVEVTGATAMLMNEGMDTGDMLKVMYLPLTEQDDAETVFSKMGKQGGRFLCDVVEEYAAGNITPVKQNDDDATFAPPIEKNEGDFDFSMDAHEIVNKVRGLCMWPNALFMHEGKRIKVTKALYSPLNGEAGSVVSTKPLTIAAENGSVQLLEVVPEGSKKMTGTQWAAGRRFKIGDRVG